MMNKIRGIATCSLLLLLGTQGALAIDPFYADKARGWFWHEQMEEEAPPPKPQMPPPPAPAPQEKPKEPEPPKVAAPPEPAPFSVDWFQKNLKQLRNKAIDDPTPENVTAMLAAERVMRDKATALSAAAQQVMKTTPWLDENARAPATTFGVNASKQMVSDNTARWGKLLGKQTAIWFFFRSDCPYCKAEIPVLKFLERTYGFTIMPISLDGKIIPGFDPRWVVRNDKGQAESLNVSVTPTLFIARPPRDVAPLAYGLTSADEIIARTIDVASSQGWIEKSAKDEIRVAKQDPIRMKMTGEAPVDYNDPKRITEYVKRALKVN